MEITTEKGTLTITQAPYINGGSFTTPDGWAYEGDWYEAMATDEDDNEYRVIWTDIDTGVEDESEAADWDHPDYIIAV